jgi:hypothetical protein
MKAPAPLFVFVAVVGLSCGLFDESDSPPSWVGLYTIRADTARKCVEEFLPETGRRCICGEPGHYEGTLTLAAGPSGIPTGELAVRECNPSSNPNCGSVMSFPVLEYASFPPKTSSTDTLHFCAGSCIGITQDNGGWDFSNIPIPNNTLSGRFRRADGNVRACGADGGPFTAVRQ